MTKRPGASVTVGTEVRWVKSDLELPKPVKTKDTISARTLYALCVKK